MAAIKAYSLTFIHHTTTHTSFIGHAAGIVVGWLHNLGLFDGLQTTFGAAVSTIAMLDLAAASWRDTCGRAPRALNLHDADRPASPAGGISSSTGWR
jgi:hypothetical protein